MMRLNEMPDEARVWLYQADRFLSADEVAHINTRSNDFLANWTSHGTAMDAAIGIVHNRILVVAADEQKSNASGCGIDKSVRFVQELSATLGVDFFQRTTVLYQTEAAWNEAALHTFWAMRKALLISDDTLVLDTTVRTIGQFRSELEKPFSLSWHAEMWGR